jgi:hypothetical protein
MKINEEMLSESQLSASVKQAISNSTLYNTQLSGINADLLNQYNSELYGDEEDGQSQVVTSDISDVVESDIASLVRIFLSGGKMLEFVPISGSKADILEAKEKTEYINHIVKKQKNSFKIIHDWMKSSLIQKYSVVKYFVETRTEVKEDTFKNVNADELVEIESQLETKNIKSLEIVAKEELEPSIPEEVKAMISQAIGVDFNTLPEDQQESLLKEANIKPNQSYDVTFRIIEEIQCIKIQCVPTENFIMTEGVFSKEEAPVVGDRLVKTRGDLLAEGYSKKLINSIPHTNDSDARINDSQSRVREKISYGSSSNIKDTISNDWANEEVEIYDLYVKIDFDGDGIAERRHILMSGDVILENEVFNHVPYAILSSILMPFEAIGKARSELAQVAQRIKTVVTRQMLDNMYMSNNQRIAANENVNYDDLLDVRPNGLIRVEGDNPINNDIIPVGTQFTGDRSLLILQHLDNSRANSTGNFIANQGLDKDAVSKETATRFQGVKDAGAAKIELVARVFAETGFKDLFEGLAYLVKRYQDDVKEISVLGKPLSINPATWLDESSLECKSLDEQKQLESMQAIYSIQKELILNGSVIADQSKLFNTLDKITNGLGLYDTSKYFNDPALPEQTLIAENEQMKIQLQQMQTQIQQMENPLAEAEKIKAESSLIQANAKQQLDIAKLQENQRQFDLKMQQEREKFEEQMVEKLTELELKYNKDVPGAIV